MFGLQSLLNLLAPEKVRSQRVNALRALPYHPMHIHSDTTLIHALTPYTNPQVRDAIIAAKFDNNHHAQTLCAQLLDMYCAPLRTTHKHIRLVPIPLSRARYRERGYNQVAHICAQSESVRSGFATIDSGCLQRVRSTKPQTSLDHSERWANVSGAFRAIKAPEGVGPVFLIDDMVTTGATLESARNALSTYCAPELLALAYAPSLTRGS